MENVAIMIRGLQLGCSGNHLIKSLGGLHSGSIQDVLAVKEQTQALVPGYSINLVFVSSRLQRALKEVLLDGRGYILVQRQQVTGGSEFRGPGNVGRNQVIGRVLCSENRNKLVV